MPDSLSLPGPVIAAFSVSQERTFDFLQRHRPGVDSLHVLPSYGHLDPFLGKKAADNVFPLMLAELER